MAAATGSIKDFCVVAKLYNNQLRERRERLGLTPSEFCARLSICYGDYLKLEGLRRSPFRRDGRWRLIAERLATFYGCLPEDLFPDAVHKVEQTVTERRLNAEEIHALSAHPATFALPAAVAVEREEFLTAFTDTLLGLTPRERKVLTLHYGLSDGHARTLHEVGEQLGISQERVRQIEAKALRKLRHPSRSKHLVEGLEIDV